MPIPLDAGLPPGLQLTGDYIIRLDAIDPVSGATVSGVVISDATFQVEPLGSTTLDQLQAGPYLYVQAPEV